MRFPWFAFLLLMLLLLLQQMSTLLMIRLWNLKSDYAKGRSWRTRLYSLLFTLALVLFFQDANTIGFLATDKHCHRHSGDFALGYGTDV